MGIRSRWRAGHMKDPVSGVFRVADWYDAHPHSSPPGTRLTGVITADGISPTPAETPVDHHGKWVGQQELPVTVDRADPANFRVEWDQIVKNDWRETARQRASEAAANLAAQGQPGGFTSPGTGPVVSGLGDLSPMVERALRSAGMDPGMLNSPNVHVEMSVNHGAVQFTNQGTPATGVVTAVHDVPAHTPLPDGMSQADLTLDIRRPDGSTYPATTRLGFRNPARRAAIAVVGRELPLLVSDSDPGRVMVDVSRLNLPD